MANLRRAYTKEQLDKMDVALELLTNRYLLSTILSNLYRMNKCMDLNFQNLFDLMQGNEKRKENKQEKKVPLASPQRKEINKEKKRVRLVNQIQFEKFAITSEQHEALVKEYGVEIVTEASMMLDGYLKENSKDIKDSYRKLKQWAIHLVMKDRLSNIRQDIGRITSAIEYESIEDITTARKYIASVPDHIRNVDYGVKYLVEKFNIT